ncbi:hypothetical protein [Streptomyces sp. NPDC059278]
MKVTIRDARSSDVVWMSNNTEGWMITAEPADRGVSLAEALHALVA